MLDTEIETWLEREFMGRYPNATMETALLGDWARALKPLTYHAATKAIQELSEQSNTRPPLAKFKALARNYCAVKEPENKKVCGFDTSRTVFVILTSTRGCKMPHKAGQWRRVTMPACSVNDHSSCVRAAYRYADALTETEGGIWTVFDYNDAVLSEGETILGLLYEDSDRIYNENLSKGVQK